MKINKSTIEMNTDVCNECGYGFRILGGCNCERRLIDWQAALAAYAACDSRAAVEREAYLSAFRFGAEFRTLLESTGSLKGYSGPCAATWLWFDIDREDDLEAATRDARALCGLLLERYRLEGDKLLLFYSGSKGFHVGLPTALWAPSPSAEFHRVARCFAEHLAEVAKVSIDTGVYDRVRAFRAPNSLHPKTGLHKRRLEFGELMGLKTASIVERAAKPAPFVLPAAPAVCPAAVEDWRRAAEAVERRREATAQRRTSAGATLNRSTLAFIREGAGTGDRHRLLFSAAANLAELDCPVALAHALLTEAALDCGLPPKDVRRQIDCGLAHPVEGDARDGEGGRPAGSDAP
jgi:hypothetical protein